MLSSHPPLRPLHQPRNRQQLRQWIKLKRLPLNNFVLVLPLKLKRQFNLSKLKQHQLKQVPPLTKLPSQLIKRLLKLPQRRNKRHNLYRLLPRICSLFSQVKQQRLQRCPRTDLLNHCLKPSQQLLRQPILWIGNQQLERFTLQHLKPVQQRNQLPMQPQRCKAKLKSLMLLTKLQLSLPPKTGPWSNPNQSGKLLYRLQAQWSKMDQMRR